MLNTEKDNTGVEAPFTEDDVNPGKDAPGDKSRIRIPRTTQLTSAQRISVFNRNKAQELLYICFACILVIFIADIFLTKGADTKQSVLEIFKFVISGTIGYLFSKSDARE